MCVFQETIKCVKQKQKQKTTHDVSGTTSIPALSHDMIQKNSPQGNKSEIYKLLRAQKCSCRIIENSEKLETTLSSMKVER